MYKKFLLCVAIIVLRCTHTDAIQFFDMTSFGVIPGGKNLSAKIAKALNEIHEKAQNDSIVIRFQTGIYNLYPEKAVRREYYISNHAEYFGANQPLENPSSVGISLEGFGSLMVEGNGALFVCHGCMLPISLVRSTNCTLQNFNIDFQQPSVSHIKILKNEGISGITFEVFPEVDYRITQDSIFETYGLGRWGIRPFYATVYEGDTKRIAYNTGDVEFPNHSFSSLGDQIVYAPHWHNEKLKPGHILLLRTWDRPAPGIFLFHNLNTTLKNIKIHYAEGMGMLAQLCENVTLDSFSVCFSGRDPLRYITTMVDATHFSHCRGKIVSTHGYYENMGDDAINVHGVYMEVKEHIDDHTVIGRFMYEQTYGFDWGFAGDKVQFVSKKTSENVGDTNCIARIFPADGSTDAAGVREFKIIFKNPIDKNIRGGLDYCMENLTWTPEVYFSKNTIRNNRARGALFTTPKKVVVESNLFDHVSGAAILISGDCSYWYESGACRDILIRGNRFVNVLTSISMEANAVISISPVIKDLSKQKKCFHGGKPGAIRIVNNIFEIFDAPVLYAKSVDGLLFKNNTIHINTEYIPYHWNHSRYHLNNTGRAEIE